MPNEEEVKLTPREKALKEAQEMPYGNQEFWKLRAQMCEQKINQGAPMPERTLAHEIHKILFERSE